MSLADIYNKNYGETAEEEKTASEIEKKLDGFTDEEVTRLDAAGGLLDAYGMDFEDGHAKLAAAAGLLDSLETEGEEAAVPAAAEVEDDENLVQDEDGNVFRFLGNVNDVEPEGDEKTAAEHDAAGRIMAQGFHAELAKLNK